MVEAAGALALVISSLTAFLAWRSGVKQNRRTGTLDEDRIRAAENNQLIQNVRADNADLRVALAAERAEIDKLEAEVRDLRRRLNEVSRDCETCRRELARLTGDDPTSPPTPPVGG